MSNDTNSTAERHVKTRGFTIPAAGFAIGDRKTGIVYIRNHSGEVIKPKTRILVRVSGPSAIDVVVFKQESGQKKGGCVVVNTVEDLCTLMGIKPTKPSAPKRRSSRPKSIKTAFMNLSIDHQSPRGAIMGMAVVDCGEAGETPIYFVSNTNEAIKKGTSVEVTWLGGKTFVVKTVDEEVDSVTTDASTIPSLLGVNVAKYATPKTPVSTERLATKYGAHRGDKVEVSA